MRSTPKLRARTNIGKSKNFAALATSSPWLAMASMTLPRWRLPMSASPWALARTVAIESAGITLLEGDLRGIVKAIRLSRLVMRNIRQNLFFAFIYNVLGVPIAAGALYPFTGLLLSPMIASAAMSLSSVSVIANALRLRKAT